MTASLVSSSQSTVDWQLRLGDMASLHAIVKAGLGVLQPDLVVPDFDPDQPGDFMVFQILNQDAESTVYSTVGGGYDFAFRAVDTTIE